MTRDKFSGIKHTVRQDVDGEFYKTLSLFIKHNLKRGEEYLLETLAKSPSIGVEGEERINLFAAKNLSQNQRLSLQNAVYRLFHPLIFEQPDKEKYQHLRRKIAFSLGVRKIFNPQDEIIIDAKGNIIEKNVWHDKEKKTGIIHFLFSFKDIAKDILEFVKSGENSTILKILFGKEFDEIDESEKEVYKKIAKNIIRYSDTNNNSLLHSVALNNNGAMIAIIANSIKQILTDPEERRDFLLGVIFNADHNGQNSLTVACKKDNILALEAILDLFDGDSELLKHRDQTGLNPVESALLYSSTESIKAVFNFFAKKSQLMEVLFSKNERGDIGVSRAFLLRGKAFLSQLCDVFDEVFSKDEKEKILDFLRINQESINKSSKNPVGLIFFTESLEKSVNFNTPTDKLESTKNAQRLAIRHLEK